MRLYLKYIAILIKAQLQYRTSFILLCVGQFFVPFTVFLGLYMLFQRFGSIAGWNFYEVALCFAVTHLSFGLSEALMRGFDNFSGLIIQAGFDRLLLRPRNLVLQVIGSRFEFTRIGRLAQGLIVLAIALSGIGIAWSALKILTLILMIISGTAIFTGIFIFTSTMCFWTVQGLEIVNVFTDGGREATQYPLDIYKKGFREFFTFVIPFGMVNYIPMLSLLDRASGSPVLSAFAPLVGVVFIVPCVAFWYFGVKHYKSTGS